MPPENVDHYDHWLDPWSALICANPGVALDVGCGPGYDSEMLRAWGFDVTATDVSEARLEVSKVRNPGVRHVLSDARTLLPFANSAFDVVVASLSLHYFDEAETVAAFESLHRVLRNDGLFAFRVNAWDDYHFGAPQVFEAWQLVRHRNAQKQFFTETMIRDLTANRFELLALEKGTTPRYGREKSYYRAIGRKKSTA